MDSRFVEVENILTIFEYSLEC